MNNSYKKLDVYAKSRQLVVTVYSLLKHFPAEEKYALGDQMRRAVISVPSNIAEGLSRTAPKEQAHFLDIAYGSLMETDCQLDISLDLGYISREMREMLDIEINSIGKMIRSLKSHRQSPIANCQSPKLTDICRIQKKVVILRAKYYTTCPNEIINHYYKLQQLRRLTQNPCLCRIANLPRLRTYHRGWRLDG